MRSVSVRSSEHGASTENTLRKRLQKAIVGDFPRGENTEALAQYLMVIAWGMALEQAYSVFFGIAVIIERNRRRLNLGGETTCVFTSKQMNQFTSEDISGEGMLTDDVEFRFPKSEADVGAFRAGFAGCGVRSAHSSLLLKDMLLDYLSKATNFI